MTMPAGRTAAMSPDSAAFQNRIENSADILTKLATAVVVCNQDLQVISINPSAQALLDASAGSILGASVTEYFIQSGIDIFFRTCLSNSQSTTVRQTPLRDTRHRTILVDCIASLAYFGDWNCLVLEFNEVNAFAEQLSESVRQTGQSANTAVLRAIAHEIKNPLGGLRGAAQLLERKLIHRHDLKEYTHIIAKETDRLCTLVDRMSGLYRQPSLATLNVHEALEHVRKLMQAQHGASLSIIQDYDPSLPKVLGDMEHLIQAFLNLMQNATEACAADAAITLRTRVQRHVNLHGTLHKMVARIDVEDYGAGVDEALQDQIFLPMISGKPRGEGLGLAIVHQIVRRHGGDIFCDSIPGKTCFTMYLKFAGSALPRNAASPVNGDAGGGRS